MDRGKLKTFAVEARKKLINDVKVRLGLVGIGEEAIEERLEASQDDLYIFDLGNSTYKIEGKDISSYKSLKKEIEKRSQEQNYKEAYKSLVEEVAYSWFNRIIAIRFMEVNAYLPEKIRVLSSDTDKVREPDIVKYYDTMDLGLRPDEIEALDRLRSSGKPRDLDELYRKLFIAQCNSLSNNLPELFEAENDYSELLLNISYLDEQGIVVRLREDLGEGIFDVENTEEGQIEVIGWLYQYYNTELKEAVDKANKAVNKHTLPAKTQLFTPEWIVKYMVENSLGRIWIEKKIGAGDQRSQKEIAKDYGWKYFLEEAEQLEEVRLELNGLREDRKDLELEEIRFIDPSMGSGHVLVYAFDIFMEFYREEGYTERDAARLIVEKNLYGLDIDKRAYQLAYFALLMKARKYDRRILRKEVDHNLYYFIDTNKEDKSLLGKFGKGIDERESLKGELEEIVALFENGRELGSVISFDKAYDFKGILKFLESYEEIDLEIDRVLDTRERLKYIVEICQTLDRKYHIVVTNPPYLGSKYIGSIAKSYINKKYPETKSDLFAVFMERGIEITENLGYMSMVTMQSWMFLSSYEKMRKKILNEVTIANLLHMDNNVMRIAFGTSAFTLIKANLPGYKGTYNQIKFNDIVQNEPLEFPVINNRYNITKEDNFKLIPGFPIAYWASYEIATSFKENSNIDNLIVGIFSGNKTAKNDVYLKKIWEVDSAFIGTNWVIYAKGGSYKKWYGNIEYIMDVSDKAIEFYKKNPTSHIMSKEYWLKEGITYTDLTTGSFSCRYLRKDMMFDMSGPGIITENNLEYIMGFLNSHLSMVYFRLLNASFHYKINDIRRIPIILSEEHKPEIDALVEQNISISKIDWDSYETSWDFEKSPLLDGKKIENTGSIEEAYRRYRDYANGNFRKLKANEERLNQIFIEIYGLEDELTSEVSDRDITITKVFDRKEDIDQEIKGNRYVRTCEDLVKDFVSYGVGCIFGRYSLDEEGLVFAGGDFKIDRYTRFKPLEDNIALVTDLDYMEGDLASKFFDFVEASFGSENLEENLDFIGNALSTKKSIGSREKIRNYLAMEFYEDHVKKYQKTPIYWLYDSDGARTKTKSKHGFKALIYMHRYNEDTSGRVRVDYLHKVQARYGNVIKNLEDRLLMEDDPRESKNIRDEIDMLKARLDDCKAYDEKMNILSNERISIDLDDGVKVNYEKIQKDSKGKKHDILRKI